MTQLNKAQRMGIFQEISVAQDSNDMEAYVKAAQKLPLLPHLAKVAKRMLGKEGLLQSGFDLSEAERAYGKNWLEDSTI